MTLDWQIGIWSTDWYWIGDVLTDLNFCLVLGLTLDCQMDWRIGPRLPYYAMTGIGLADSRIGPRLARIGGGLGIGRAAIRPLSRHYVPSP